MTDQLTTTIPPKAAPAAAEVHLSGDVFGALINLSGRRRFTSQRVVLYAVLASMGHEGAVATARETLALFRDAHTTLIDGKGNIPGIFCGQLRDAYFGTLQGDKVIRNFIKLAEQTLDGIVGNGRGAPVLLDELVRSATPLAQRAQRPDPGLRRAIEAPRPGAKAPAAGHDGRHQDHRPAGPHGGVQRADRRRARRPGRPRVCRRRQHHDDGHVGNR